MFERVLRLPVEGHMVEESPEITKLQFESCFEGEMPPTPRGCRLDAAKPHWKQWFKFVNDYLLFRPQKNIIDRRTIVAAMKTADGEKVNWARIVQQGMFEEIEAKRAEKMKALELYSACYISLLCEELPTPAVIPRGPSSSRLTASRTIKLGHWGESEVETLYATSACNGRWKTRPVNQERGSFGGMPDE